MNKSLKWVLLAVIIFISVVVIDQNLNGVEFPVRDFSNNKMVNLGAVIICIMVAVTVVVSKYLKKRKD
jgi:hypothetical protein